MRPGDLVTVWPAGRSTRVERIVTWDGDLDEARAGMSVTVTLADEIDISRGDMLSNAAGAGADGLLAELSGASPEAGSAPAIGQRFRADVVWMDERLFDLARVYLLKHTT